VIQPDINVGPFNNLQPYLYWSSCEPLNGQKPCRDQYGNPATEPAPGFGFSFSFGNGFQGTDLVANDLYVMVYYSETPAEALAEAIDAATANHPHLNALLSDLASQISSAPTFAAMELALNLFVSEVNATRGKALTAAQADYLIALAQATAAATGLKPPPPPPPPPCKPHCI